MMSLLLFAALVGIAELVVPAIFLGVAHLLRR